MCYTAMGFGSAVVGICSVNQQIEANFPSEIVCFNKGNKKFDNFHRHVDEDYWKLNCTVPLNYCQMHTKKFRIVSQWHTEQKHTYLQLQIFRKVIQTEKLIVY